VVAPDGLAGLVDGAGAVALGLVELPDEAGADERLADGELPDELVLEPELSQATSDRAESSVAAISHFLSISISILRCRAFFSALRADNRLPG
jgi:hypothetical protein